MAVGLASEELVDAFKAQGFDFGTFYASVSFDASLRNEGNDSENYLAGAGQGACSHLAESARHSEEVRWLS